MVNEVLNYSAAVEMLRVPLIVRQTTFFLELEKGPSEGSQSQRRPLLEPSRVLNVKALVGTFNQEKATIGALSVIVIFSGTFG